MRPRAFQYVELGEEGARVAGGARGAAFLNFRNGLREALRFAQNPTGYVDGRDRGAIITRVDVGALVAVVTGAQNLVVHVDRVSDIRQVLGLRAEFPRLKLILLDASEGWLVAGEIAAARVPVVLLPLANLPGRFETLAATMSNAGRLVAAGVEVAVGLPELDASYQPRLIGQYAGNLVAQGRLPGGVGLTHAQALATITAAPARIFGIGAETGTLSVGKRADLVLWDGDPLELDANPTLVMIDGREQPLTSRQTKLRDRYLDLTRGGLPPGYTR